MPIVMRRTDSQSATTSTCLWSLRVGAVDDDGLRFLLLTLSPTARDNLRRALILDQPDRDAIAAELLRYGDANGDGWADVIDTLTMYPDVRRRGGAAAGRDWCEGSAGWMSLAGPQASEGALDRRWMSESRRERHDDGGSSNHDFA